MHHLWLEGVLRPVTSCSVMIQAANTALDVCDDVYVWYMLWGLGSIAPMCADAQKYFETSLADT